jgi:hypothetical protein
VHNETQVSHNKLTRSFQVLLIAKANGKCLFVFPGKYLNTPHGLDIGIQTADGAGKNQVSVCGSDSCRHGFLLSGRQF